MAFLLANLIILSLAFAILAFVFIIVTAFVLIGMYRPFMKAFMSGHPVSLLHVVAMKVRKTDVNQIIDQGTKASKAGHPIDWVELERAYLSGVDCEKVVLAYITAKKRDLDLSFEEIVDAARESRLEDLLRI